MDAPEVRQALALHEVLGLVGLEETGAYPIAQRVLADLYRARAEAEKKRLENNEVYAAKIHFYLRIDPHEKELSEMEVFSDEVVRVVDRFNQRGESLVAVVDTKGQYGWTRLDNLKKATSLNVIAIEKLQSCQRAVHYLEEVINRKSR